MRPDLGSWLSRLGWALAALMPLLAMATVAEADLESKMREWVQGGGALHLNDPSSYRAQGRSYLSGGSMLYRVPSNSHSLAGFRAPHFSVGCGGIDIYGGSFNLIEADQFITILEETVQNAEVFFIDLALRTVSPQIANTMEKVYGWLEKLNEISIDSCQTGRALANALYPQQEEASMETECIRIKQLQPDPAQPNRLGLSYADASEACKSGRASSLEGEETTAFVQGNLTWNAIEEVGLFTGDDDFKEILMSILGTLVKRYEDASGTPVAADTADGDANSGKNVDFYESKLITNEDSLLDVLRFGGSAEVYQCRAFAGLHTRYRSGGPAHLPRYRSTHRHRAPGRLPDRAHQRHDRRSDGCHPQPARSVRRGFSDHQPLARAFAAHSHFGGGSGWQLGCFHRAATAML